MILRSSVCLVSFSFFSFFSFLLNFLFFDLSYAWYRSSSSRFRFSILAIVSFNCSLSYACSTSASSIIIARFCSSCLFFLELSSMYMMFAFACSSNCYACCFYVEISLRSRVCMFSSSTSWSLASWICDRNVDACSMRLRRLCITKKTCSSVSSHGLINFT